MRQIDILRFWFPLFASWLLMMAEGPLISAAVNRQPDEVVMLASLGIVISLSVLVESPVINVLATATALVHDRGSYLQVRRFTLHTMIVLTGASSLLAFTPLFDLVVVDAMAVPAEVVRWVRPGLRMMVPWSAAIGWRRFLQGVMIHFGRTRQVAWGTAIRMTTVVASISGMLLWGGLPGVYLGAVTYMSGVMAEAVYVTIAARPVVRSLKPAAGDGAPSSYGDVLSYHLPLAGTAFLTLFMQPMVSFALARLDHPTLSLAAWPVIIYLLLLMRASALSLPEAVIALGKGEENQRALRRFSLSLAAASLAAMVALVATPAAGFYLEVLQSATPEVTALCRQGFLLFLPLPALATLVAWLRGLLMGRRRTAAVNAGMVVRLGVFMAVLGLGIGFSWQGIPTAAWATNLAVGAELVFLAWEVTKTTSPRSHVPSQQPDQGR